IDINDVTKLPASTTVSIEDGKLVWNIGNIPAGDPDQVLATLTYKVKVKGCDDIVLNDDCEAGIFMHGEISGRGQNSGQDFDSPFVRAYTTEQTDCLEINDPVFGGHDINIDLSTCNFTPIVGADPVPP